MNIFVLDESPKISAQMQCDKHVVKMILETAQLLCSAHWMTGSSAPYKLTHKNHPAAKWTRKSLNNYRWLVEHGLELCNEYTYRYNKVHKTRSVILWLQQNEPNIPESGFENPPKCMPDYCKSKDVVDSYRKYYINEKKSIAKWSKRPIPNWYYGC